MAEDAATEVSAPPKSWEPNCWDDPDGNMNVVVVDGDAGLKTSTNWPPPVVAGAGGGSGEGVVTG